MKTVALLAAAAVMALTTSANATLSFRDVDSATIGGTIVGFASLCEDAGLMQYGRAYLFSRNLEATADADFYKAFSSGYNLARNSRVVYNGRAFGPVTPTEESCDAANSWMNDPVAHP